MKKEDVKKELENYIFDVEYFLEKSKEREKYKDDIELSILRIKSLSAHSSADTETVEKRLDQVVEREIREEETLIEILNRKQKIENVIKLLDQPYRNIIYLKYIRFYTYDQIADKMHYSSKRVYQLHAEALEKFVKLYLNVED